MTRQICLVPAALVLAAASSWAHYPFPTSRAEREKAEAIAKAVAEADEDAVAALTTLLDEQNPRVQAAALVGLLQLSHQELDFKAPLAKVKGWQGPRPPYTRAALTVAQVALEHRIQRKRRVGWLVELTKGEKDWERRMAVEALRRHDDDAVLEALQALANDPFEDEDAQFDAKAVARVAFEAWWAMRAKGIDRDERPPILVKTLRLGEPYRSRWCDAACDLLAAEGQSVVPLLVPLLKGEDRRSKLWATRTLREIAGGKALAALRDAWVQGLDSQDRLERDSAFRGLLLHPDRRALPRLVRHFVKKPELLAAWQAAYDLGKRDDDQAIPKLQEAAEDHRELVRTQAAADLAHRGKMDGQLTVLTGLRSQTEVIRLLARWALPRLEDRRKLTDRLIELLKVKPEEAKLPERQRDELRRIRVELLREIRSWDPEAQDDLRLQYAIRDLLEDRWLADWAAIVLRKMGYELERRDGKYKVIKSP